MPEEATRISAIDIGSNSIRQIIADVSPEGRIRVLDEIKASPRLGAGLDETGQLSVVSVQNALATLARMAALAKQLGAKRTEVIATSAVRGALNGQQFLDLVREETGLRVKVVDGVDEAALSFRSALAHFDLGVGRAAIIDIGGGSLEIALSADGLLEHLMSLPLGAIRMTEQFLSDGKRKGLARLRKHARKQIVGGLSLNDWRGSKVICSGGTATNLAAIFLARKGMETARTVHGTVVPRMDLEHIVDWLHNMSLEERKSVPGLNPVRADIIVAGLGVIAEVVAQLKANEIILSAYGIREGVLLDAARVTPVVADPGEARARSVRQLAERSHYEELHAKQVQKIALQLFDAIGERLGCEPDDRQLLADAALLHDIGYHINYDKHHKHSYHLIQHAELLGLTPADQIVVANVARYHRGAEPNKKHENLASLHPELRRKIVRLSAILRVADGFDRGHTAAVDAIKVRWMPRALRITAVPNAKGRSIRLDLWGAARKSKLLSKLADTTVEIVAPDGKVLSYDDEEGQPD
ncbi:MAG TPA: Ppx/GppA phosphatase family protein [Gemmatimonadaceae bacterium]|nr:Ppx/GppA phosphatase family protein [Gemmatimonadaceae bacterium]